MILTKKYLVQNTYYSTKLQNTKYASVCEIEAIAETHIFQLRVILRSSIARVTYGMRVCCALPGAVFHSMYLFYQEVIGGMSRDLNTHCLQQ